MKKRFNLQKNDIATMQIPCIKRPVL